MQRKIIAALQSDRFFIATILLLVVQAGWIALTARYPQAFDEQFHLGIIRQYAHQWSPFFLRQPAGADSLGPLTASTSFLYHYMLSWPYRLIVLITPHRIWQVTMLRFVNIALFVWGLYLFRRLLSLFPASKALVHMALLFFVLIPVVPLLAGQINYDNLLLPIAALTLLWAARLVLSWRRDGSLRLEQTLRLAILGLLGLTVKYAYAPFYATAGITIIYIAWRTRSGLWQSLGRQARMMRWHRNLAYGVVGIVALGLVAGSYGRNLVSYQTPLPACDRVLGAQRCMALSPWARNYQFIHDGQPKPVPVASIPVYDRTWVIQSITELIFSISSNFEADGMTIDYHVADPLPVLEVLAWTVFAGGVVLGIVYRRRLWRLDLVRVTTVVSILYVGCLWIEDYLGYVSTGYPVAIHGRYLLPLLPLWLIGVGMCCSWLLASPRLRRFAYFSGHAWLVVGSLVLVLQGGGFITYIIRSDDTSSWRHGSAAQVNQTARKLLKPVIIGH